MQQLWNEKAKHFPRFIKDMQDTLEILDFFRDCGVDFTNKTILDIGCGNGRFTLQFAFEARLIYGSDISESMLLALNEDAKKLQLSNVISIHSEWDACDLGVLKPIDIAFASMTPALNNKKSFEKALNSHKEGFCYVGWGRRRESALLEPIMKAHHLELALPIGLPQVLEWLKELGYETPKHRYQTAHYTSVLNREEAIENIAWNIRAHNANPDMNKISHYVDTMLINGSVTNIHKREIGLAFIPHITK